MTRSQSSGYLFGSSASTSFVAALLFSTACGGDDGDAAGSGSGGSSSSGGSGGSAGHGGSAGTGGTAGTGGSAGNGGGSAGNGGAGGTFGTGGNGGNGGTGAAGNGGQGPGGAAGAGGAPFECEAPAARSWGSGKSSGVLALLADAGGLWVGGYENAQNLERDGDTLGFIERWPSGGGEIARYTLDDGDGDAVTALLGDENGGLWFAGYSQPDNRRWQSVLGRLDQRAQGGVLVQRGLSEAAQHPTALARNRDQLICVGYEEVLIEDGAVLRWEDASSEWYRIENAADPVLEMYQYAASDAEDGHLSVAFVDGSPWIGGFRISGDKRGGFVVIREPTGEFVAEHLVAPGPFSNVAGIIANGARAWVAGTTSSTLGEASVGGQDGFLGLMDASGSFAWLRQFGTENGDLITAMTRDQLGNLYVAGETDVPGGSGADIIAFRFDRTGKLTGSFQGGSRYDETVSSIAVDVCGVTYVAGSTLGDLSSDSDEELKARQAYVLPIEFE